MSDWNTIRAKLNHDLLKNQVVPTLDRLRRIAEGSIIGKGLLAECIDHLLWVWREFYSGITELFQHASMDRDFVDLFSKPPLSRLETSEIHWIRELINNQYSRFIQTNSQLITTELAALDTQILSLQIEAVKIASLERGSDIVPAKDFISSIEMIRTSTNILSRMLSALSTVNAFKFLP